MYKYINFIFLFLDAVMNNELKEEAFILFKDVIRYLTIHIILDFGIRNICYKNFLFYIKNILI